MNRSERSWPIEALAKTVTGLVFACLVAFLLVSLSGTRPFTKLERWGSDFGMLLHARVSSFLHKPGNPSDTSFVFLDTGRTACLKYVGEGRALECDHPSFPPLDFLAAILNSVKGSQPKVIIIDFPLDRLSVQRSEDKHFQALRSVLSDPSGPVIIAPAMVRPTGTRGIVDGNWSSTLFEAPVLGRLRLASFLTWTDPDVNDRVIRSYPATVDMELPNHLAEQRLLPSAPFLASLLVRSNDGVLIADCLFYPEAKPTGCDRFFQSSSNTNDQIKRYLAAENNRELKELLEDENEGRLFFSVLSLANEAYLEDDSPEQERLEDAYRAQGLINRFEMEAFIYNGVGPPDVEVYSEHIVDRVVVVGTSETGARDWHITPLGPMAGAEIIVNATRAFLEFSPLIRETQFWPKLLHKLELALVAAVAIFVIAWLPAEYLHHLARNRGTAAALLLAFSGHFWFIIGVAGTIGIVGWANYEHLARSTPPGIEIDFLVPTLAVAFEGLIEVCQSLLATIRQLTLKWLITPGSTLVRQITNSVFSGQ